MSRTTLGAMVLSLAIPGCMVGEPDDSGSGSDFTATPDTLSSCANGKHYAGYDYDSVPSVGGALLSKIKWNGGTLASGHIAAYAGAEYVVNHALHGWIQAGIEREFQGNGLRFYIEYQDANGNYSFNDVGPATAGNTYTARIAREGSSSWTASVGGHSLGKNIYLPANQIAIVAEDWNTNGLCNGMSANFSGTSPYGTATMYKIQQAVYRVSDVTSNGWLSN
jgi:hypothetical protein